MDALHDTIKTLLINKNIETNDLIYDLCILLNEFERSVKPISLFLIGCSKDENPDIFSFLIDTFRTICKQECMTKGKSKSEAGAVRNLKEFLEEVKGDLATVLHSNFEDVRYLVDSPCYQFR